MDDKKISVIIPAYNESEYIGKTIKKFKEQDYSNFEIIVVDNSDDADKTYSIAKSFNVEVLRSKPKGLSRARNTGAEFASGEILLFSDADSWLEKGGLDNLAKEFENKNIAGSFLGKSEKENVKNKFFFFFKNWINFLGLHKGATAGTVFCSKDSFLKIGGFDEKKEPAEISDFFRRGKPLGLKYRFIRVSFAITSMRRYEKKGYIRTVGFWVLWKISKILNLNKNLAKNYYNETKDV